MRAPPWLSRDRLAVVAALVATLALTVILVPSRTSFPNTDAALALVLGRGGICWRRCSGTRAS